MNDRPNSPEQLAESVATILVSWPLYRTFTYYGRQGHPSYAQRSDIRYGPLPKRLRMFCNNVHCQQDTWWETDDTVISFTRFITPASYVCRNCGRNTTYFYFIWQEQENHNILLKIGQYPELEERIPETVGEGV
jgi:hypothetical protein